MTTTKGTPEPGAKVRLQKVLAQAGVASRRRAEALILEGKVRVNGQVVTALGTQVDPRLDRIEVEGHRVALERPVYVLLFKPRGFVSTAEDPEGRPTVMSLLGDQPARLFPVGRLDFNTEGALLFTNDGELAHRLMHPRYLVEKTYELKLRGIAGPEVALAFQAGVTLDDGTRTQPAASQILAASEGGNNTWLEVTLHEGKNRQIHRMAEAVGYQVAKLRRVRYAGLDLTGLRPGRWRDLTPDEVRGLKLQVGMAPGAAPAPARDPAPGARPGGPTGGARGSRGGVGGGAGARSAASAPMARTKGPPASRARGPAKRTQGPVDRPKSPKGPPAEHHRGAREAPAAARAGGRRGGGVAAGGPRGRRAVGRPDPARPTRR